MVRIYNHGTNIYTPLPVSRVFGANALRLAPNKNIIIMFRMFNSSMRGLLRIVPISNDRYTRISHMHKKHFVHNQINTSGLTTLVLIPRPWCNSLAGTNLKLIQRLAWAPTQGMIVQLRKYKTELRSLYKIMPD